MSDSPRWERESQEPLHPEAAPAATSPAAVDHGSTVELDMAAVFADVDAEAKAGTGAHAANPADPADPAHPTGSVPSPAPTGGLIHGPLTEEDAAALDDEGDRRPALGGGARERIATARESLGGARESFVESFGATREGLAATAGRVGRWLHSLDRRPEFDPDHAHRVQGLPQLEAASDPLAALGAGVADPDLHRDPASSFERHPDSDFDLRPDRDPEVASDDDAYPSYEDPMRFPVSALGYNRAAVDGYVAELEAELARLRAAAVPAPPSITEELERIGEQTASILVVAHDKATETARRAHEQAERAVSSAAADAERITSEAERRLRDLDEETDAVWRERERLLDDVRAVSANLHALAQTASARFPADERGAEPEPTPAR